MESTESHRVDAHSLRANKLTLVERLSDDLAHEIKNPLHSMVINLEVLKRRVSRWSGADASELMRYVGILSGELDRVSRRVDLLLRMVRPVRDGEMVVLSEEVQELLEMVELEGERRGVTVDMQQPTGIPRARFPRDPGRQIILNLLVVSMDAAAPGGTVTISAHAGTDEDLLRIVAVPSDEGDRMPPAGVEDERMRWAAVQALTDSIGGRVEIIAAGDGFPAGTEVTLSLPVGTL